MPGRKRWGFLIPPLTGAVFLAVLLAICFLGALAPVFFLAVCLVLAILAVNLRNYDYYFESLAPFIVSDEPANHLT